MSTANRNGSSHEQRRSRLAEPMRISRGLVAELASPEDCVRMIQVLKSEGLFRLDVHMPYPSKEIESVLDARPSPLPRYVFIAGLLGATVAYLILWYTNAYDYPLNIGGRPSHAVPAFIPITFETTILVAGCAAFFGAVLLGGMPRLYHPIDEVEAFRRASVDKYFVLVDASNSGFDWARTSELLVALGGVSIQELGKTEADATALALESERGL